MPSASTALGCGLQEVEQLHQVDGVVAVEIIGVAHGIASAVDQRTEDEGLEAFFACISMSAHSDPSNLRGNSLYPNVPCLTQKGLRSSIPPLETVDQAQGCLGWQLQPDPGTVGKRYTHDQTL
jgi:hypothetical protein